MAESGENATIVLVSLLGWRRFRTHNDGVGTWQARSRS